MKIHSLQTSQSGCCEPKVGTLAENSVTVRQGDGAMQRLAKSNVLVVGAGGLGIEIGTVSLFPFYSPLVSDHP